MSGNGNGHRWSKFCWRDWQQDVALRSCSLGARGFWIECLAAMHEGNPVGHLTFNGKPASLKQMATNANCTLKEAKRFSDELEEAGVFSRATNGTIFCRRMVRDAQDAETARENGKKGGNPQLKGVNPPLNGGDKAKSLESESEKERNPPLPSHAVGGGRRADGLNPRALGTNPRALDGNPRAVGVNPRAKPKYRNGFIQIIENDLIAARRQGKAVNIGDAIRLAMEENGHAH